MLQLDTITSSWFIVFLWVLRKPAVQPSSVCGDRSEGNRAGSPWAQCERCSMTAAYWNEWEQSTPAHCFWSFFAGNFYECFWHFVCSWVWHWRAKGAHTADWLFMLQKTKKALKKIQLRPENPACVKRERINGWNQWPFKLISNAQRSLLCFL